MCANPHATRTVYTTLNVPPLLTCGLLHLDISRGDLPQDRPDDVDADEDRRAEQQYQERRYRTYKNVIACRCRFARRSLADQLHVLLVSFPDKVERITQKRYHPDYVIQPHVERHPQQRDFWHAMADARNKDIKGGKQRERIAKVRDQTDERIQPEPPCGARHAKQPVQILREVIETLFYLDLLAFQIVHKNFCHELHEFHE